MIVILMPLVLVYALFLLTSDIQEDAFITFRTAFNLADHGELSFNLGEGYSGATSYLYPFLVALIRVVSGEQAITIILIVNSIALLLTSYMITEILGRAFDFSDAMRFLFWAALSVAPKTLLMAVRGMEAPYVVLIFVLGLYSIQNAPRRLFSLLPLVVLPFIRPDAIAFSLILAGFSFSVTPRFGMRYIMAAMIGVAMLMVANYLTFGRFVAASVEAKSFGRLASRSLHSIVIDEFSTYFTSELFSPVSTKYFIAIYPVFTVFAITLSAILLWKLWCVRRSHFSIVATLLAGVWLVPFAYGVGGIIFPWYLWPSCMLYQGVFIAGVFYIAASCLRPLTARLVVGGLLVGLLCATGIQLILSYSTGVQESGYRASVGKYIASRAKVGDTLYLEPAGYIPFFAKIRTIDEVGLSSSVILRYRHNYPKRWWIEAVKQEKPTFLVQRAGIVDHKTYQGYQMTPDEAVWFDSRYELIRVFEYKPEEFTTYPFLKRLLRYGSAENYYVLKLRDSP